MQKENHLFQDFGERRGIDLDKLLQLAEVVFKLLEAFSEGDVGGGNLCALSTSRLDHLFLINKRFQSQFELDIALAGTLLPPKRMDGATCLGLFL